MNFKNIFRKSVGFKGYVTIGIQGDKYTLTSTMDTGNEDIAPTLNADRVRVKGDHVIFSINNKEYSCVKKGESISKDNTTLPIVSIDYIDISGRTVYEPFVSVGDGKKSPTETTMNRGILNRLGIIVNPSINNTESFTGVSLFKF